MMSDMETATAFTEEQVRIVPANEVSWDDLVAIFGTTDYPGRCQCQRCKVLGWIWRDSTQEERTAMHRVQTACGKPNAVATSGLVAYVDDEPAGWVAVEPRTAYPKLRTSRVPWPGRVQAGKEVTWGEAHVGVRQVFEDAGFEEVSHPTARRVVMRIDFAG